MKSRTTNLYDRHQRTSFEIIVLVLNIIIFGLALTYLGFLLHAPHDSLRSTMASYNERLVKSGHAVLLFIPPLTAIVVATVDLILYYKRSLPLVYTVIMTSTFVLSYPVVASLWMVCHYFVAYGDNDPSYCYTSYLQRTSDYRIIGLPVAPLIVAVALIVIAWIFYIIYFASAASDLRNIRHLRRQVNPDIEVDLQRDVSGNHKSKASVEGINVPGGDRIA